MKNVVSLPVMYRNQKNAWMNADLFNEYLNKLEQKLSIQNQNMHMFIDSAGCHPKVYPKLKKLKTHFFPSNCTAKVQPCDLGIINSFKCHYKKLLSSKKIKCAENKVVFNLSLLDSLQMLKKAWDNVTEQTIINCFRKAQFIHQEDGPQDDEPIEVIDEFIDDDLPICASERVENVFEDEVENEEDDDDNDCDLYRNLTCKDALESFNKLKGFMNQYDPENLTSLLAFEDTLYLAMEKRKNQAKITDFFKKQ